MSQLPPPRPPSPNGNNTTNGGGDTNSKIRQQQQQQQENDDNEDEDEDEDDHDNDNGDDANGGVVPGDGVQPSSAVSSGRGKKFGKGAAAKGRAAAALLPGFAAARAGDLEALKKLVEGRGGGSGKWDPKAATDKNGSSPLDWAAGEGRLEVCRYADW